MSDYKRIESAIAYLVDHTATQPSLKEMAEHVHLSPYHFQRLFCRWAGTTPKRFLEVLTLERGKSLLTNGSRSLLEVSHDIGLSSSSRLYDHFVQLEAVTPGEYKNRGRDVHVHYGIHPTPFGRMLLAVTQRGVCRAVFLDFADINDELEAIHKTWPLCSIQHKPKSTAYIVETLFGTKRKQRAGPLSLHVAGTNFQIAVWRALMNIPQGTVASYSQVAKSLGRPRASRAVGRAIGANPVTFLIPCHRVIQQSGALGGYRWGSTKKQMILTWEQMQG
jgi:AraC family transcriptional regulator of adaptative response/methylated-DNA-[protein]-cysteine methyltransferase